MSSACVCHTPEWCFYCEMYVPLEKMAEEQAEEIVRLKTRVVPDTSLITHNEHFQLKCMTEEYGAELIVNIVKHIDYLSKLERMEVNP